MKPRYEILEHKYPSNKGYRILETNMTCDGPRTRIVEGFFTNYEQALEKFKELEKRTV